MQLVFAQLDDPRLDGYLRVRERDLVGRQGLFVAEGEVVLRVLVAQSRYRVRSVLIAKSRVSAMEPLLAQLPDETPVFVLPQADMDALVGFPIHRGLLALGERGASPTPADVLHNASDIALGLIGLVNHDNVGGAFRNAAAFGLRGVIVDPETCDPLYRKSIRVSVGGALLVPFARAQSPDDVLDAFEAKGFELVALSPRGMEEILDISPPSKVAVIAGAEGPGLPESILARCRRVRIGMAPGFDSLNVSVACGIALHALREAQGRRSHARSTYTTGA